MRTPADASLFNNASKWGATQVENYVRSSVFPKITASLAFAVICLVTLVVFLLWRLFRRCCMWEGGGGRGLQAVVVVRAACALAANIVGSSPAQLESRKRLFSLPRPKVLLYAGVVRVKACGCCT